jgi:hypothetical protein
MLKFIIGSKPWFAKKGDTFVVADTAALPSNSANQTNLLIDISRTIEDIAPFRH